MFAIRSVTTGRHLVGIRHRLTNDATTRHFFSTTTATETETETETQSESETGAVKFYNVGKAYGFITSATDGDDIFVHRTQIVGATNEDIKNPVLLTGENVRFCRKTDGDKVFASDVKYEDGSMIPLYRQDFVEKRTRSIKGRLGFEVYEILSRGGDEESAAQKIAEAYTTARDEIENASNKMNRDEQN